MDSLEEMDRFLEKFNLPRLNQAEIESMNNQITNTEIETVIKNLSPHQKKKKRKKEKSWGWGGSKRHFKSQEENYEISVCLDLCMSHSFSSVAQLCLTLCDPRDCSTPSLSVHHQLPELTQSHVH